MESFWTDERVTELRDLWAKGPSAEVIARTMRITRNAVLGKVHRLKLEKRSNRNGTYYGPVRETIARKAPKRIHRDSVFKTADQKPMVRLDHDRRHGLIAVTSPITGAFLNVKRRPPSVGEMTKNEMRDMLTQAVRNTAAMS